MSGHTRNVTRTHKLGQKGCRWQLISGGKHKYQWGMYYRCVELLPLLRVIPTHTPSLLMLRHSRVVHSCVVHPCFFVPTCPLPRCPPLLLRATLSTLAMSTSASSCRLVHSRVVNSRDFSAPLSMKLCNKVSLR